MSEEHCQGKTYQGRLGFRPCWYTVKRDGYCGLHHPDTVKARRAKETAKYEAKHALKMAKWTKEHAKAAADRKRLELYPRLVEGLKRLIEVGCCAGEGIIVAEELVATAEQIEKES